MWPTNQVNCAHQDFCWPLWSSKVLMFYFFFTLIGFFPSIYLFPFCAAELIGCDACSHHGTCYTRDEGEVMCECFHWYAGDRCQINLKGNEQLLFVIFYLLIWNVNWTLRVKMLKVSFISNNFCKKNLVQLVKM